MMVTENKKTEALATSLPIIDITGYSTATPELEKELCSKIREACSDKGFFYIVGHGIDQSLILELLAQMQLFFGLPENQKRAIDKSLSPNDRGYEAIKNQTLEEGTPPDLKEGFYLGAEYADDHQMVKAGRFGYGKNQWPSNSECFQKASNQYINEMTELATSLMSLLALSLNLPKNYFAAFNHEPAVTLRMLHYPPQPENPLPNEKGCGAHTDFGGLTLLLQDHNGGLQVWDRKQEYWIDAKPVKGSFIVNLGDMISRWTNDKYQSTLHRVINKSGKERYSMPFFFTGNPEHIVSCIPTCLDPNESPKYPPISVEQHMRNMYKKTYV